MNQPSANGNCEQITAVLGPTNTGKTHLAIERLLGHSSGIIGLPLRLLAREVYEQIKTVKGAAKVALITGEERIIPANPSWFVSTVEAMPTDRPFALVAIDEAQLASDPERGHIFTERILHSRGFHETLILGAETLKPVLKSLLPGIEVLTRPRFSELKYSPPCRIEKLPRRSAIVAFSAAEVYRLADEVRRIHGGCAVIMGNLSPRTRNAQVSLFQSGEVDYLVATDAIGLGLNLSLAHVAFAGLRKFDGKVLRYLHLHELAQIAGRAGRHQSQGSFSTLVQGSGAYDSRDLRDPSVFELPPATIAAIEDHRFPPLKTLFWRNSDLDFGSLNRLLASLEQPPPAGDRLLRRKADADDHLVLQQLSTDDAVTRRLGDAERVKLLWSVCQIPDYGKSHGSSHRRLVTTIFDHLSGAQGRIPGDWLHQNLQRLDDQTGGVEQLSYRLAQIRTMAYVAHRPDWLHHAGQFQILTSQIEERLSDSLHTTLTQLFVDRRATVMNRKLGAEDQVFATIDAESLVWIDGHTVGRIEGLRFIPADSNDREQQKTFLKIARRSLGGIIQQRLEAILNAPLHRFKLTREGQMVGKIDGLEFNLGLLQPSDNPLQPKPVLARFDLLPDLALSKLQARLTEVLAAQMARDLGAVIRLTEEGFLAQLTPAARGLAYCLYQNLGWSERQGIEAQIKQLTKNDRKTLAAKGLRFGQSFVFVAGIFAPSAQKLLRILLSLNGNSDQPQRRGLIAVDGHWLRLDHYESLTYQLRQQAKADGFVIPLPLRNALQIPAANWENFVAALRQELTRKQKSKRVRVSPSQPNHHSPFKILLRPSVE